MVHFIEQVKVGHYSGSVLMLLVYLVVFSLLLNLLEYFS